MLPIKPRIKCADGVSLSVQADQYKYCTPRNDEGPYCAVEVGFITDGNDHPMAPPDTWKDYSDGEFPSDVYGYVPVELVESFIESHGGILSALGMARPTKSRSVYIQMLGRGTRSLAGGKEL